MNNKLQNQYNPRRRLLGENMSMLQAGTRAYLDLVSSPVPCALLAQCSFPLYRNKVHLALSARTPQVTPPLHHGQALHSYYKDHGQPEPSVCFSLQCYPTVATGHCGGKMKRDQEWKAKPALVL